MVRQSNRRYPRKDVWTVNHGYSTGPVAEWSDEEVLHRMGHPVVREEAKRRNLI